jgi:UDP-glucose:tetrahydrobiopterin glucosyltransferase
VKIAVVASPVSVLRPAQLGGAQAFVCDLAAGLAQRGHDVTLYCAEGSEVPAVRMFTVPLPADAQSALVMPRGRPVPAAPGVRSALATMFESIAAADFDVVSQHAFDAPAFQLAQGMRVLHTLHLPPLVPAVTEAASRVPPANLATVSRSCRSAWSAAGVDVGHVLPNGVAPIALPIALPTVAVDHVALIAGRISPEKGIEHALAAARAAGLDVTVAGDVYDPDYEVDLSAARQAGPLRRDDLRRLMARSAVTVCAVRWDEPFGMVAAEAQMSGCPVAAYRRGAMPEVVEDGVSGALAEPDDVEDLRRAIDRCLSLDRAGVTASARRRLGLEAALDRYEPVLREVAR